MIFDLYNTKAEQYILGCMIKDSECAERIMEFKEEHFYQLVHKTIYNIIKQIIANGEQVDLVSVSKYKNDINLEYIVEIAEQPTTSQFEHYFNILKEYKIRRDLEKGSEKIKEYANDVNITIDEVIAKSEQVITDIDTVQNDAICKPLDLVVNGINQLEARYKAKGQMPGITTGFYDYNKIIYGFRKKYVYIIGGRPSMGKTALATSIMLNVSISKAHTTLFFSLEMPKESIYDRLISGITRIPSDKIILGDLTEEEWERVGQASLRIEKGKLFIEDTVGQTAIDILAKVRRFKKKYGLELLIIDHLTEIKRDPKEQVRIAIGDNLRTCRRIARELDIPVVILAQLNRDVTNREDKRPTLADVRESGEIEEIADVISFIHREHYYNDEANPYEAELITRKNRSGRLGTAKLIWQPQFATFSNMEHKTQSAEKL